MYRSHIALLLVTILSAVGVQGGFLSSCSGKRRCPSYSQRAITDYATTTFSSSPLEASSSSSSNEEGSSNNLKEEAARLLERAREIRSTINSEEESERDKVGEAVVVTSSASSSVLVANQAARVVSEWQVNQEDKDETTGYGYRLYVDIGREEGTWMDPKWGASGQRIELTLDVVFLAQSYATPELQELMVKDNLSGKSSAVYGMIPATKARLREGFDQMKTTGKAAYRLDKARNGGLTARFFIDVEGIPEKSRSYGDLSIPEGCLYFSIPCFGGVSRLSSKEGIVTVRQIGWNTGWRREESRIVGTFTAIPIQEATRMDRY